MYIYTCARGNYLIYIIDHPQASTPEYHPKKRTFKSKMWINQAKTPSYEHEKKKNGEISKRSRCKLAYRGFQKPMYELLGHKRKRESMRINIRFE